MGHLGSALRIAQAILYIFTFTAGIACCICIGWTTKILPNCILYADMTMKYGPNKTLSVDLSRTLWGPHAVCAYGTFTPATASIYAIIWFWFYILMSEWKGGVTRHLVSKDEEGHPPDIKLLVPSLIFNIITFICVCVSTGLITVGSNVWCESVEKKIESCDQAGVMTWSNVQDGDKAYRFLQEGQKASWVLLAALGAKIILVSVRLKTYVNTVEKIHKSSRRDAGEALLGTSAEDSDAERPAKPVSLSIIEEDCEPRVSVRT